MDVRQLIRSASFPIAHRGYSAMAVHRILNHVEDAVRDGEPWAHHLDARLELVSFGYDPEQVDALFAQLRDAAGDQPRPAPSPAPRPAPRPPTGRRNAPPAPPSAPDDKAARLQAVLDAAAFHAGRRNGYSTPDVDDFIDVLTARIQGAEPIGDVLASARFRLGGNGYDTREVDDFIRRLTMIDTGRG